MQSHVWLPGWSPWRSWTPWQWKLGLAGGSGGANAAHSPFEVKPGSNTMLEEMAENSIIMVNDRDVRVASPFQCWLTREIMANSASSINVLTERDQVMPPNAGFHISLFGNYTLDGVKAVIIIALDTETGAPNAGWDRHTATALSHPANFHPFSWPTLRDTSASYTDVKVYNDGAMGSDGNFHIAATSKLWVRMQREGTGPAAPLGPPLITEGAWKHAAERVVEPMS